MRQVYRTLRVVRSDEGVLGVMIDAPPMNLIGPELVRDLVTLIGELESDQGVRVGTDTVKARAAALFAQGLQTRGPLELDLGDRIGSL